MRRFKQKIWGKGTKPKQNRSLLQACSGILYVSQILLLKCTSYFEMIFKGSISSEIIKYSSDSKKVTPIS